MSLTAFQRKDGRVGIRNHLFTMPAVVCANQVALDEVQKHPQLKFIEHQHGCAQIGADLEQTRQVMTSLALHPNAYATMIVGLGCEGVIAKNLYEGAKSQSQQNLDLVIIQDAGGTLGAENQVEQWIAKRETEMAPLQRVPIQWSNLVVGVMVDPDLLDSPLMQLCIQSLRETGAHLGIPADQRALIAGEITTVPTVHYGHTAPDPLWLMQPGSNELETATGLTAAGVHLLLHLTAHPHAFGSPLSPTVRWCVDERTYRKFYGDFDGQLQDQLDVPRLMEQLVRIANGQSSVAETYSMDDFALYRIGPTV
ncbi:hypothetical protein D2Q93_12410 [Alicyclobacillaceae bacterium I2511]|nr:hypothetical protein D2Q93_12410 [Alicyclobacillaceae bacterium I2511]